MRATCRASRRPTARARSRTDPLSSDDCSRSMNPAKKYPPMAISRALNALATLKLKKSAGM